MSRNQRLGLILGAVAVLVVAFLLIRPTDDEEKSPEPASAPPPRTTTPDRTAEAKPRKPPTPTVTIRNGKPAGGVKTIEFDSGDSARINVKSNQPAEIHLHGYNIEKPVQPGKTTVLRFKADIDGIFEFEDHDSGSELAKVKVNPQ